MSAAQSPDSSQAPNSAPVAHAAKPEAVQAAGTKPVVATFAGSDSAGIAGLQMDTRSQTAMGVHSASMITAVTAQNSQRFISVNPVADQVLAEQCQAVAELPVAAIKIGLIANRQQLQQIAEFAQQTDAPVVCDPVLSSTSGAEFSDQAFIEAFKSELLPLCTLLTPNLPEAERLTGLTINSHQQRIAAAKALLAMGVKAVLIKGGHSESDLSQDYFHSAERSFWLSSERKNTVNTRGTGCALASVIASALAQQHALADAVVIGKMAINQGLREGYSLGADQAGPVAIDHFPSQQQDLPLLSRHA